MKTIFSEVDVALLPTFCVLKTELMRMKGGIASKRRGAAFSGREMDRAKIFRVCIRGVGIVKIR